MPQTERALLRYERDIGLVMVEPSLECEGVMMEAIDYRALSKEE